MKKSIKTIKYTSKSGNIINELLNIMSLELRIKTTVESYLIHKFGGSFFIPLDEEGNENQEVINKNKEILEEHKNLLEWLEKDIKQWKLDRNIEKIDEI